RLAPMTSRLSDGNRCCHRRPVCQSWTKVSSTADGRGNVRLDMKPLRVPISASASSAANRIRAIWRTGWGAKPPPRKGTGRTSGRGCFISAISTINQFLIRSLRLRPHQLPELSLLFFKNGVAKMTLGKGNIDIDNFPDLSGPSRQHHDPMTEPNSLVEIVRDIDRCERLTCPQRN